MEDFPESPAKMLAGSQIQRLKMQNYLTKECEFHMETSRKVGRSKLQSARVRAAAGTGAKSVMMDRTVRMSQLWGECRYCPKFPEKNVQNSKKMYKNKKKMCKNKKNVQYSDDPGITSGHMLEVLA